jgi:CIC family chloride channel protein
MIYPTLLRLVKLRVWIAEMFRPRELQITLLWAGLIGFLGGLASIIFRKAIIAGHWLFTHHFSPPEQTAAVLEWWQRLLVPTVGGLCAGLVLYQGMRFLKGQTAIDYMEAISIGNGNIRIRSTLLRSLSSLLSIASGGSIGREGPMVQLSATIASLVGRKCRFSPPRRRLIVACGAAAGIASAYNAPIAGALFVAEIVLGSIAMESFGPLIFSSVIATATVRHVLGANAVYEIPKFPFLSNFELITHGALGLVAGALGPWFMRLLDAAERCFAKIPGPAFLKPALGGAIVGAISLYQPEVWGNGFLVVDSIVRADWLWQSLLLMIAFKLIATAATVGSGAVGGVFTPTLFVGAALGSLFGQPLHALAPHHIAHPTAYAVIGMGCFLAATTHAPLMSILMIFELTLDYSLVLPLMIGCVIAHYTSQAFESRSIYSDVLRRKKENAAKSWREWKLESLIKPNPVNVRDIAHFEEITETFAKNQIQYLYVVNADGRFVGAISLHDIKSYLNDPDLARLLIASDFMNEHFPTFTPESPMSDAMEKFAAFHCERLPVVNSGTDKLLLGSISKTDLLLLMAETRDNATEAPRPAPDLKSPREGLERASSISYTQGPS